MKERIMKKIKKCLKLAQSSNPNESATAIRRAQALMREHGFTMTDIELSDVQKDVRMACRSKDLSDWIAALISTVNQSFGTQAVINKFYNGRTYTSRVSFYGADTAPELAGYTFDVLRRQLTAERKQYMTIHLPTRMRRSEKTRRGNVFAMAAVVGIAERVRTFAMSDAQVETIKMGIARDQEVDSLDDMKAAKTRETKVKASDGHAIRSGTMAAESMHLNHGVNGQETGKLTYEVEHD